MTTENKYERLFCHAPFQFATIDHNGHTFMCCPAWLTKVVGNLSERSWDEVWNSPEAIAVRESIHDGSFKFCNELNCPHLRGQQGRLMRKDEVVDPEHRRIIDERITVMPTGPRDVTLQYDPTCNLTCPSCRTEVYKCNKDEGEKIKRVHEAVWTDTIKDARRITIAGNGDPFASKLYLSALRSFNPEQYPEVRLALISNGLLLTPKMWESISNCHRAIESLHISWNAATPETFRVNQRGGEMAKLMENMAGLAEARKRGELVFLSMGFYVLNNNFREMREIIRIGKHFGVDRVLFGHIMPPPYMDFDSPGYKAMAVHLPDHPDHAEFLDILKDDLFTDPIVSLTNLTIHSEDYVQPAHRRAPEQMTDHLGWLEFLARVQPTDEQAALLQPLLHGLHEHYLDLHAKPTQDGAPAPIEYLAQMLAEADDGEGEAQIKEFMKYAAEKKEAESGLPYAAAFVQAEKKCRRQMRSLLSDEQRECFDQLPIQNLMAIEGYNAVNNALRVAVEAKLAQLRARTPLAWNELRAWLGLTSEQAAAILELVNEYKQEFVAACSRTPLNAADSPIEYLASLVVARDAALDAKFLAYVGEQLDPDSGVPFTTSFSKIEQFYRTEIRSLLDKRQRYLLKGVNSLMDINTGADPMGDAIRACAAQSPRKAAARR